MFVWRFHSGSQSVGMLRKVGGQRAGSGRIKERALKACLLLIFPSDREPESLHYSLKHNTHSKVLGKLQRLFRVEQEQGGLNNSFTRHVIQP